MSCLTLAAIGLHLASQHISAPEWKDYNNNNPGVYAEAECGLTAGVYYNSIRKVSVHVGYTYDMPNVPVFVSVGAATGYYLPVTPMVMGGFYMDRGDYRIRIGYIPKVGTVNDTHVLHLMIERRF